MPESSIQFEQAKHIAVQHLRRLESEGSPPLTLLHDRTQEEDFGWVFFYQAAKYLETGSIGEMLAGNAPLIVTKIGGRLHETGTARPLKHYLETVRNKVLGRMAMSFDGNRLTIDGMVHDMEYPVIHAVEWGGLVLVLLDPGAPESKARQFRNLIAMTRSGEIAWRAELPTTTSGDCYYRLMVDDSVRAASGQSFLCTLDPRTGRILKKEFVK